LVSGVGGRGDHSLCVWIWAEEDVSYLGLVSQMLAVVVGRDEDDCTMDGSEDGRLDEQIHRV
jgi:hypothetical protein